MAAASTSSRLAAAGRPRDRALGTASIRLDVSGRQLGSLSRPLKRALVPPDARGVRKPYTLFLPVLVAVVAVCAARIAAADSGDDPPATQTLAATAVTGVSAVLHGVIDDNGGHVVT